MKHFFLKTFLMFIGIGAIPIISILFLTIFIGITQFFWFKTYDEYSLNVCKRSADLSYPHNLFIENNPWVEKFSENDSYYKKKEPDIYTWFDVCGMAHSHNSNEIQNNNNPDYQFDFPTNKKVEMICYENAKCPATLNNKYCYSIDDYSEACYIKWQEFNKKL